MAGFWMKLDWDWREDPAVMEFEDEYGKAALVDLIELYCVMSEFYGILDMNDKGQRLKAQRKLGMTKTELETFIDQVASCGLISQEVWSVLGKVSSERSIKDGNARRTRKEAAAKAGEASGQARRAAAEARSSANRT